jgi:hypothetical protein
VIDTLYADVEDCLPHVFVRVLLAEVTMGGDVQPILLCALECSVEEVGRSFVGIAG